jgi:exonuclease SbcC
MHLVYGIKGIRSEVDLDGLDVFTGPNGSGKTAVLQALQFALLGRVPGIGQRALGVLGDISVVLQVDAVTVRRTLTGGRSGLSVTPSRGERTLADKEERLAALLGAAPLVLDFAGFAGSSGPEQRRTLLTLAGGIDGERLRELCGAHWPAVAHLWNGDPEDFLSAARRQARDQRLEAERALAAARTVLEEAGDEGEDAAALRAAVEAGEEALREHARWEGAARERAALPPRPSAEEMLELRGRLERAEAAVADIRRLMPAGDTSRLEALAATAACPVDGAVRCPVDWSGRLSAVRRDHAILQPVLVAAAADASAARAALRAAEEAEARWVAQESRHAPEPPAPPDVEALRQRLYRAQARDQAVATLARCEAAAAAAQELEAAVGERSPLADAVLEAGLEPLRALASRHSEAMGCGLLSLSPLGMGPVAWDACSSGERAALALSLGIAMLERLRPPLRLVLLDNAECLDPERRARVFAALAAARAEGCITHAVVAGVLPGAPDGWTHHRL